MCVCVCVPVCIYVCVPVYTGTFLELPAQQKEGLALWDNGQCPPNHLKGGSEPTGWGDCVPGCPVRLPPGPHQECQPLGSTQRTSLMGSLRGKRPPSPSAASAFGVLPWGAVCDPTLSGRGTCMCHMEVTLVLPRATLRTTSLPSELCLRTSTAMIWF